MYLRSLSQRTAASSAANPAHCDPVRSAAGDEQAGGAGRRNKLGAGGNSEDPAGVETAHRPDAGAAVAHGDAEIADGDEQTAQEKQKKQQHEQTMGGL